MKKYKIIYADPPWDYGGRQLANRYGATDINEHYPTMEIEDICKLPIKDLADKDCVLFMWVTYPHLEKSFEVIKAWGFKYSTVAFEWFKTHKTGSPTHFMGAWVVGGAIELCLLAHKGSPKRIDKTVKRLVFAQRQEHSKKPDEVRKRIVDLMGDIPRIELFARDDGNKDLWGKNRMDGWDTWGNEVKSDIKF